MPLGKFTLLTTLAVIPWSALFVYLGMTLGNKWEDIDQVAAKYTNEIILVAIALIIIYFVFKWYKSKKKGTTK
jgi:membrane protein DedA with SNARE-associated domain